MPVIVTLDGVQIGHPVDNGVSDQDSCDQIAAIGVADGIVRGVSHHISKGFSLGILATSGEMIEFRLALAIALVLTLTQARGLTPTLI